MRLFWVAAMLLYWPPGTALRRLVGRVRGAAALVADGRRTEDGPHPHDTRPGHPAHTRPCRAGVYQRRTGRQHFDERRLQSGYVGGVSRPAAAQHGDGLAEVFEPQELLRRRPHRRRDLLHPLPAARRRPPQLSTAPLAPRQHFSISACQVLSQWPYPAAHEAPLSRAVGFDARGNETPS